MARKATGKSKRSRSTTKSKTSRAVARKTSRRATARPKVATKRGASKSRSAKGDFGIKTDTPARRRVAMIASEETKNRPAGDHRADPRQPRTGIESRQAGVGMRDAGPGSDTGGDVDRDIVGVGDGAGLAQSGPDDEASIGAAETDAQDARTANP